MVLHWHRERSPAVAVDPVAPLHGHRHHVGWYPHAGKAAGEGLLGGVIVGQLANGEHSAVGGKHAPTIGVALACVVGRRDGDGDCEGALSRLLNGDIEDVGMPLFGRCGRRFDGGRWNGGGL